HVMDAIDRLPAGQRAVLILRDIEGCAAEEACTLLGITPENQRVLLHRARGRIRAMVDTLIGAAPAASASTQSVSERARPPRSTTLGLWIAMTTRAVRCAC